MDKDYILKVKGLYHQFLLGNNKTLQVLKNVSLSASRGEFISILPQLFTPNLKTIQNPCLSLDPGWFLFSPNGCF
ncbi:hypothetical protein RK194_01625, partial [Streptococcus pneumoniae]|nr:hypothetical protein [Streptococcus pneumoniae]